MEAQTEFKQDDCAVPRKQYINAFMDKHGVDWGCYYSPVDSKYVLRATRGDWTVESERGTDVSDDMGIALVELVAKKINFENNHDRNR
jgi:hypothetical protein